VERKGASDDAGVLARDRLVGDVEVHLISASDGHVSSERDHLATRWAREDEQVRDVHCRRVGSCCGGQAGGHAGRGCAKPRHHPGDELSAGRPPEAVQHRRPGIPGDQN